MMCDAELCCGWSRGQEQWCGQREAQLSLCVRRAGSSRVHDDVHVHRQVLEPQPMWYAEPMIGLMNP